MSFSTKFMYSLQTKSETYVVDKLYMIKIVVVLIFGIFKAFLFLYKRNFLLRCCLNDVSHLLGILTLCMRTSD